MFQFGLFSTFIPYLLFAIAYIGFLGNNALNNNQHFDYTGLLSTYKISITDEYCESPVLYLDNENILPSSNFKTFQVNEIKLEEINFYTQINHLDKFDTKNKFINCSIFTRPPPKKA